MGDLKVCSDCGRSFEVSRFTPYLSFKYNTTTITICDRCIFKYKNIINYLSKNEKKQKEKG